MENLWDAEASLLQGAGVLAESAIWKEASVYHLGETELLLLA